MITYFCPACWEIVEKDQGLCPYCGHSLDDISLADFDDKLIAALRHPVAERKIMAAQVLGNRQCERALPEFVKILAGDEKNYFFLRAILLAVARIDSPDRENILSLAINHPSELVSQLAAELLADIRAGKIINLHDRHTG